MTVYLVVPIIIALIAALIVYVSIAQYLEKKRAQQQRLLMTLKTRHRNITHMLNNFPPYYLPPELTRLVYTALIDICQQLQEIEPENNQNPDEIVHLNLKLDAMDKTKLGQRVTLDSPQQIKDIRQHLQTLQHFVSQQEVLKVIDKDQTADYMEQVNALNFQLLIDEFIHQAKVAQQSGKLTPAIHYYNLAKTQLQAENKNQAYDLQLEQLDIVINKLEADLANSPEAAADPVKNNEALSKEWDAFKKTTELESSWQKKQAYD